jgi:uncharacterized membrane protein
MTETTATPPAKLMAAKIIYGLMALGFIFPVIPPLAGLIYAYVARGENSVQDSHLGFQIRTFWVAFALGVICILTAATVVGLVVAVPCGLFAVVWTLLRLITGFVRATKDQPITGTRALGLMAQ